MGVISRIRPHVLNRFGAETVEIPSWLRSSLVGYWSGGHRDNVYYPLPMKNEIIYNPSTWVEWTKQVGITADSTGLLYTGNGATNLDATVSVAGIKGNTQYILMYILASTTLSSGIQRVYSISDTAVYMADWNTVVGAKAKKFTTSEIPSPSAIFRLSPAAGTLKITDVRLLECPVGSQIESDFTNLTAGQLNAKYPFGNIETIFGTGNAPTKAEMDLIYAADGTAYWDGTRNVLCNPNQKYYWADYSGNGRHGKLTNFAYTAGSTLDQYGAYFDGVDDYISIADSPALRLTQGGTLFAWINAKGYGGASVGYIMHKGTDTAATNGYVFGLNGGNGSFRFTVNNGTYLFTTAGHVILGRWLFVSVTFSSAGRVLYANAVNVTDSGGTQTGLPPDVAGVVCIGNRAGATDRGFDGQIGLCGICTRALTASEIKYLFDSTRRRYGV